MAPIQFLKFPLLVKKAIIGQLDFRDIIELTMLSKRFRKVIQTIQLKVDTLSWSVTDGWHRISVENLSQQINGKLVTISEKFPITVQLQNKYEEFAVISARRTSLTNQSELEYLEKLAQHLMSILKIKNIDLSIFTKRSLADFFIWKHVEQFNKISLGSYRDEPCYLSPVDLKFLLEEVTANHLVLNITPNNNHIFEYRYTHEKPSKIRNLEVQRPNWVDLNDLLDMDIESITCDLLQTWFPEFMSSKINNMLKHWISGKHTKLERLILLKPTTLSITTTNLFKDIKATPSIFSKNDLPKFVSWKDVPKIMDIKRDYDGRQATVYLSDEMIVMCVWTEKFLEDNLKAITN